MELKQDNIVIIEIKEPKQDDNRDIYYHSLYWRLYNYILAC